MIQIDFLGIFFLILINVAVPNKRGWGGKKLPEKQAWRHAYLEPESMKEVPISLFWTYLDLVTTDRSDLLCPCFK